MRHLLLVTVAVLLVSCSKNPGDDIVSPTREGQAAQRDALAPADQPAFDRYVMIPGVPYTFSTKDPDNVDAAVRMGEALLASDATGETKTPATRAAESAALEGRYRTMVDNALRGCRGLKPKWQKMCVDDARVKLMDLGVPAGLLPS